MSIRAYGASLAAYDSWVAEKEYSLTDRVQVSEASSLCYECTTAGLSGSETEPKWPTQLEQTVADGTVIWTCKAKALAPAALTVILDTEGYGGLGLLEVWVKSDEAVDFTVESSFDGEPGTWRYVEVLKVPKAGRLDNRNGYFNAYRFVKVSTPTVASNEAEIVAGAA